MRESMRIITVCALVALAAVPVWAGNGNMLHGFGPVNSSMAGAGAGLWMEPVGALMFNPALLAASEGSQITFATEFFEDGIQIEVTLNDGSTGRTNPSKQAGVLPSFGWSMHEPGSKWAYGFGLIGIAGFRTDYPEDPASIVFNNTPLGFGRIYTDHRVTKIPIAVAYQATPKLALGASLNAYLAELAIAPLPHRVFDENEAGRFYAQGGNLVSEMAFSVQLGFYYTLNEKVGIGGSLTTAQDFDPFTWNSEIANPTFPNFGANRPLDFDLDGPLSATVGAGIKVNPKTNVAVDILWIQYDGVAGFGSPGGIVDGIVFPFGWKNVWAFKAGVEYKANSKWTLRAGYNHADTPLRPEVVLTATGAPATFQKHYTAGAGFKLTDKVTAEAGFYIVPREHIIGPYPDLQNVVQGTMDTSNKLDSVLIGLNWSF